MKKFGTDPKVKKTLVRNYDRKTTSTHHGIGTSDAEASSSKQSPRKGRSKIEGELNRPQLCSSEILANYLTDITKNIPPSLSVKDQNIDKEQIKAKMTKKLNFHFNEKMYKNLVALNASAEVQKSKKDKRSAKPSTKRDLEPNIEDFCHDEKEADLIPTIPIPNSKFKPIKKVDNKQLHNLMASFEKL